MQSRRDSIPGDTVLYHTVSAYRDRDVWLRAAAFLALPDFPEALLDYCRLMCAPPDLHWPATKIFGQKIRYITCYCLIGNYARSLDDPAFVPSLSALQAVVPASPRQVADQIRGLRAGGYVQTRRDGQDARALHLVPSPSLVREIARSPLSALQVAEAITPGADRLHLRLLEDPDVLCRLLGLSTRQFHAQDILFRPFPTIVSFSGRDAGYLILTAVVGAALARGRGDERWDVSLSYHAMARRFQVSRQHIGNLYAEGEAAGLFRVVNGRLEDMSPELLLEFRTFVAGQMAHYRAMAELLPVPVPGGAASSPSSP
ncbi:MarR family transcriptional regulator [Rhizobium straminoryzae]|uniref:MarR family transcriptional regulator n=1 Tax=Rhizobium straminoryzae TaxID=1387186 RepID=A0A549SPF8_9HYPH|nr:MarR family transcriptional regulator [Rhizobium straminoryzae]TRL31506.1 MarR family transcriptional regulator [Rhizobium straminoryzae]